MLCASYFYLCHGQFRYIITLHDIDTPIQSKQPRRVALLVHTNYITQSVAAVSSHKCLFGLRQFWGHAQSRTRALVSDNVQWGYVYLTTAPYPLSGCQA